MSLKVAGLDQHHELRITGRTMASAIRLLGRDCGVPTLDELPIHLNMIEGLDPCRSTPARWSVSSVVHIQQAL